MIFPIEKDHKSVRQPAVNVSDFSIILLLFFLTSCNFRISQQKYLKTRCNKPVRLLPSP